MASGSITKMKCIVFGATGFVGLNLVRKLVKDGNHVTCFVRNNNVSKLANLNLKLNYGNILDLVSVKKALKNQEIVYYLIGVGSISAKSKKAYNDYYKVNVDGTKNFIEACKEAGTVKRIVYFGSISSMGVIKGKVATEESECNPPGPYQKTKLIGERLILDFAEKENIVVSVIRPSMVYGSGSVQGGNKDIFRIARFSNKRIFPLFNSGSNYVPLVHVRDVVQATVLAATKGKTGVYLITNEEKISMKGLVQLISKKINKKVFFIRVPFFLAMAGAGFFEIINWFFNKSVPLTRSRIKSMTTSRIFDISKAKMDLGFRQEVSIESGVAETVDWYKKQNLI
jgi:nucleoside-diphosphate-sugar epimerase